MTHTKHSFTFAALGLACGMAYGTAACAATGSSMPACPLVAAQSVAFGTGTVASTQACEDSVNLSKLSPGTLHRLGAAASNGDANAQYTVGMLYHAGRDNAVAVYWLNKAALQGHVPAQFRYSAIMANDQSPQLGW